MSSARFSRGTTLRSFILTARKAAVREECLQTESTTDEYDSIKNCGNIENNSPLNKGQEITQGQKASLPVTVAGLFKSGSAPDSVTGQESNFETSPSSPTSTRS